MTKGRLYIRICAVIMALTLLPGCLFGCRQDGPSAPSSASTISTTTTEPTTEATTLPTETTEAESQIYWVFAYGGLWVRTGPGTDYALAGSLKDGEEIEVRTWKDGWAYIEKPVKGWCSGNYLHKLGWYKDVKTPEGTPPQDNALNGKWVHMTAPVETNGIWTCTAGIIRLRSNGTFIHRVDEYQKNAEGKWEAVNTLVDHPYWVGEYDFDGRKLTLAYMAELVEEIDAATGTPKNREWTKWIHTLTMDVTINGDTFTVSNGKDIPLTVANEHAGATENTLYKASNGVGTPEDVCQILDQQYQ